MKTLLAKVQRLKMFRPGETVVVAVSGGADSVALLDVLARLDTENLHLVVAHLNHCLRGDESDGDEAFVRGLAAGHGVPFISRRVEVAELARRARLSVEDAGRRARYELFAQAARQYRADSIALAHHRDDQAETVLIRLLRGAGATGLSGMPALSGVLKRPLLGVTRAEIECYLKHCGLSYRTDASNSDTTILRNSIRHELLPLLQRYNPKVSERLAATAEILACDEELLDALTETAYGRMRSPGSADPELCVAELAAQPRGLRLRLYRRALRELRGDLQRIGLSHLEAIDRLVLSPGPNRRSNLPDGCLVARSYGVLRFSAGAEGGEPPFELALEGPGLHPLPGGRILKIDRVPRPASLDAGPRAAFLDPAAAPFPWTARSFRYGDRFRPLGMTGAQKVKDLFMNERIPLDERRRIPLLVSAGRIVWVCGVKMGQDARVGAGDGPVLRVEILDVKP